MVNTKPDPRVLRESPLQHLAGELAQAEVTGPQAVAIREIPFATMIGIRALPGSAAHEAIADVLPDGPRQPLGKLLVIRMALLCCGFRRMNFWRSRSPSDPNSCPHWKARWVRSAATWST